MEEILTLLVYESVERNNTPGKKLNMIRLEMIVLAFVNDEHS